MASHKSCLGDGPEVVVMLSPRPRDTAQGNPNGQHWSPTGTICIEYGLTVEKAQAEAPSTVHITEPGPKPTGHSRSGTLKDILNFHNF